MKSLRQFSAVAVALAALCPAAFAATQEQVLENITLLIFYGFCAFVLAVAAATYFYRSQDRRRTPLSKLVVEGDAVHTVGPDTTVAACVRKMSDEKIGALVVMDGEKLLGIFTERDALNKVLAALRDPATTRVSEVMSKDPYCVPPSTSVGEAMAVITQRRFRHLPVVQDGRLIAVVSSGDLTRWLVNDRIDEMHDLAALVAGS